MFLKKIALSRYFLIFFCPLILSACLTDVLHVGEALPEWVISPPQDTKEKLIGVGEGFSLTRAKEAALNDIAGKLGTHISSLVDRDVRQYGEQVKSLGRQSITARIDKMKLIHPQVLKSAQYEHNYYVLLAVPRKAMVRDTRSRLKDLDERLSQQWQSLSSLSPLKQFIRAKKLAPKIDQASGLAITLQALEEVFLSGPYLTKYNGYRKKADQLIATTHFRIHSTQVMRPVSQHLLERLSRAEIQSSVGRKFRGKGPVIEVKGGVKKDIALGTHFSHLTTVLELKDRRGNTVARREHKTTGKSLNNHVSATRDAISKLIKQWDREPILRVIGLNLGSQ